METETETGTGTGIVIGTTVTATDTGTTDDETTGMTGGTSVDVPARETAGTGTANLPLRLARRPLRRTKKRQRLRHLWKTRS